MFGEFQLAFPAQFPLHVSAHARPLICCRLEFGDIDLRQSLSLEFAASSNPNAAYRPPNLFEISQIRVIGIGSQCGSQGGYSVTEAPYHEANQI
ncbi:hypothetical protein [Rhizobium jaguaris]|uniref:hypothetical protein n=1 Tax=Rhizobium jaguaris TaxID=1312183 RepID=UPI0013C42305|nr:hypothetical protein [Rhizobium jaguaris]